MFYTENVRKAQNIAYYAHINQCDLSGTPLIYHVAYVANRVSREDDAYSCVALLHDVVEKTSVSLDDLIRAGFPDRVVHAVDLLTYDPRESYLEDFILRIKQDPLARSVAIEAIRHNLDTGRYHGIQFTEDQYEALEELDEMYEEAYNLLTED